MNQPISNSNPDPIRKSVSRLGFWAALLISVASLAALVIAVTTAPARSGPNCPPLVEMGVIQSCVLYPFTDVAAYVPIEYIWMFPATALALLFVVLAICINHFAPEDRKITGQIAIAFSAIAAGVHAINYFIQLAVMQPSLLNGELEYLSLYSQYNPHGIFIALEDLGYFMMGLAFLLFAFLFVRRDKLERAIKVIFLIGGILAVGGLIVTVLLHGMDLEYRYEVLSLVSDWMVLIVTGILLSVFFRRAGQSQQP